MHDLSDQETRDILKSSQLGVLSLAREGKAYAIPLFYAYDGEAIYFHCHPAPDDRYDISGKGSAFSQPAKQAAAAEAHS